MTKNFKCFKPKMASYLADECGFKLINKYYSDVYSTMVYEFEPSAEVFDAAKKYISDYKQWKESKNSAN